MCSLGRVAEIERRESVSFRFNMLSHSMRLNFISRKHGIVLGLTLVSALLSLLGIWFHLPGQISMDSSMQLYEASIGKSITWNPPYMTAILRWLGDGPTASSRMVILNSVVTYLSLSTVAATLMFSNINANAGDRRSSYFWLKTAALLLILANPILFLYVGIIWKDVLFSTLLTLAVTLGVCACVSEWRRAAMLAIMSTIMLAIAMKVRQQGVFMSPLLLFVPVIALTVSRNLSRVRVLVICMSLVGVFVLSSVVMSGLVSRTIQTDPQYGDKIGYRGLMQYDSVGTVALSQTPTEQLPIPMTEELRTEIRGVYTSDRGDFMWNSQAVTQWLALPSYEGIKARWLVLVKNEPAAYLRHRFGAFRAILNVDGVKACLPVHVGIDGNHEYLRAIGFEPGVDDHDLFLYGLAQKIIRWPIYRHWVYILAMVAAAALVILAPMERRLKWSALVITFAISMLYLSYLPTSIACDFRYLYTAICLVSLLWIIVIAGTREKSLQLRKPTGSG